MPSSSVRAEGAPSALARPRDAARRRRDAAAARRRLPAVLVAILLALCALGYALARETGLFALRSVTVEGAQPALAGSVRLALRPFVGESLVGLDAAAAERAVEALPMVSEATIDRRFPHTLGVTVVPERPVAVARAGEEAVLLAASGIVLGPVERGSLRGLPRVWLPEGTPLEPGRPFGEADALALAEALARLPSGLPLPVVAARVADGELTFVLAGKTEVRLGDRGDLDAKLRAAEAVLSRTQADNLQLAYLDVTVPTRPVGFAKSQVEGTG